jgi:hypothetical protein
MPAAGRFDQLRRYPYPVAGLAHAPFEHIAHAELAPDVFDRNRLALVGEARIAGDDEKEPRFGQCGDDVLGDAVGEEFLLRVGAPLILVNAKTAIDGLSGSGSDGRGATLTPTR